MTKRPMGQARFKNARGTLLAEISKNTGALRLGIVVFTLIIGAAAPWLWHIIKNELCDIRPITLFEPIWEQPIPTVSDDGKKTRYESGVFLVKNSSPVSVQNVRVEFEIPKCALPEKFVLSVFPKGAAQVEAVSQEALDTWRDSPPNTPPPRQVSLQACSNNHRFEAGKAFSVHIAFQRNDIASFSDDDFRKKIYVFYKGKRGIERKNHADISCFAEGVFTLRQSLLVSSLAVLVIAFPCFLYLRARFYWKESLHNYQHLRTVNRVLAKGKKKSDLKVGDLEEDLAEEKRRNDELERRSGSAIGNLMEDLDKKSNSNEAGDAKSRASVERERQQILRFLKQILYNDTRKEETDTPPPPESYIG